MTATEFTNLTFEDRIIAVDERIGNQPDRIDHPYKLLDLEGQTIYLVVSPFGHENNIGNCFILTWKVGKVMDHRGNLINKDKALTFDNDEKYICSNYDNEDNILSLKDFNIVPNNYNNHAAFPSLEVAEGYSLYRKICHPEDINITRLVDGGDYAHYFDKKDINRLLKFEKQAEKKASN